MGQANSHSIATRVSIYVGLVLFAVVSIQTYFNVAMLKAKASSNIEREMSSGIALAQSGFTELIARSEEDAEIISAHEALNSYFNYSNVDDFEGMDRELLLLETFLSKYLAAKPRYQRLEIFSAYGSVVHFRNGELAEPSPVTSYDFMQRNFEKPFWAYLTTKNNQIFINILYRMVGDSASTGINSSDPIIFIYSDITQDIHALSASLGNVGKHLLLSNELGQFYGTSSEEDLSDDLMTGSAFFLPLGLNIEIKLSAEAAYAEADYAARNAVGLAVLTFLIISLAIYISTRRLIAMPLSRLNRFLQDEVIAKQTLSNRYEIGDKDEIGTFANGMNHMLDKLQHRQAELRSSEERLALALWGSGEGIWAFSFEDKQLSLDALCSNIIGLPEKEQQISLFRFFQNVDAKDKRRVIKYVREFRRKELAIFSLSFGFKCFQGMDKHIQLKGKAVMVSSKRKSMAFSGTLQDVTVEQKSKDQTRLYASAYDASNNGILLMDRSFRVIGANNGYTKITGFTFDEIAGVPPPFYQSSFQQEYRY